MNERGYSTWRIWHNNHSVIYNSESVTQLCLILCHPMNCSPPGSSVHEILQARILEWVAMLFYKGSSPPRDWIRVSCIADRFFTIWANRHAFNLPSCAWHGAPQSLEFPMMRSIKVSWGNLRLGARCQETNQVMRRLKLSVPTLLPLWGGWRRWRVNQLSGQWFNHLWICKEASTKSQKERDWRASGLLYMWGCVNDKSGEGMEALCPFPHVLPYACLPSACSWVMSFYNKPVI